MTQEETQSIKIGDFLIIPDTFYLKHKNRIIQLTVLEFKILLILVKNPNQFFSRHVLYKKLWGSYTYETDRSIDVHICHLRKKIGKKYIQTLKGAGYKFTNYE